MQLKKLDQLPLTLWIQGVGDPLFVQKILRVVPNKRWVISAFWGEREVVAKVFTTAHHAQRELKGALALKNSKAKTPELLYHGWGARARCYILIFEKIQTATDVDTLWWGADDVVRVQLLEKLVKVTAKLHQSGLKQQDIHLQNFLWAENQLFVIDGSNIYKTRNQQPIGEAASLKNLASLLAQVAPEYDTIAEKWYRLYVNERNLVYKKTQCQELLSLIKNFRQKHFRAYGKKVFRSTSQLLSYKKWNQFIICQRDYHETLKPFLQNPEALLQQEGVSILKAGNTCTVFQLNLSGHRFVIKRYNIKSFWHGVNRAFRRTRASFYWRNAMCLASWRIGVAKPIALVEKRFGFIRRQAYYIMEQVNGMSLQEVQFNLAANDAYATRINQLFSELEAVGLSHGDLKADNILMENEKPILLDLDAMRLHRFNWSLRRARERDLKRFESNWQQPL